MLRWAMSRKTFVRPQLHHCVRYKDHHQRRLVTADPPSETRVPSNATIALTLDQAVHAVAGARGSRKAWTIRAAATLTVTWTNKDGSAGG